MIVFVEYDADGFLLHIAEVHTTEGTLVEPETLNLTDEERADRKARVNQAIARREKETRDALMTAKSSYAGLHVLPPNAARPDHDSHIFDPKTKGLRVMTPAEKKTRQDKFLPPQATGPNKPATTP